MKKHETLFHENVFDEHQSAISECHEDIISNEAALKEDDNEFDLSDISAKAQSREEIIAAAEAAAFTEAQ